MNKRKKFLKQLLIVLPFSVILFFYFQSKIWDNHTSYSVNQLQHISKTKFTDTYYDKDNELVGVNKDNEQNILIIANDNDDLKIPKSKNINVYAINDDLNKRYFIFTSLKFVKDEIQNTKQLENKINFYTNIRNYIAWFAIICIVLIICLFIS